MNWDNTKIKEILFAGSYVTGGDMETAEKEAQAQGVGLKDALFYLGFINKDIFGQAVAEYYNLSYADLNTHEPPRDQVLLIPEDVGKKHRVVFFEEIDDGIVLATDNPEQSEMVKKELKELFGGKQIWFAYSLSEDIETAFRHYRKPLGTRFSEILAGKNKIASEIIDHILEDALSFHCSDIHFEPRQLDVVIRFRVDGVLHEAGRLPREYYENILNRIKVQARLRTDEHFSAQDGSIHYQAKGRVVDLRVSIVPTTDGEKVVMRMLSVYVQGLTASDLGLSPRDEEILVAASKKPFGMILVAGPTGSGKTTTLYALLKNINRAEENVTTIEDPVEYKIEGANQIQVNTKAGLTFANGLRSIVRQDPDVILVGEIRDEETAEIAVNAALTGHLLFSTFHANDAATAIPRLLDMKIEPFLLASTLQVVVAQRLARKICEKCRYSYDTNLEETEKIFMGAKDCFKTKKITLYRGKGCDTCNNTGYHGRTAIFELIQVTPELQDLILTNPSARQIWELAVNQGARTLFDDGVEKVKNGVITLEELLRVAQPPRVSPYGKK